MCGRGFSVSRLAGLRLRHGQDDAAAQAALVHLVGYISGVFKGTLGNLGAYVVGGGKLEGVPDVLA